MTFKQAIVLGGGVRRGEKGSLVVYSDSIKRECKSDSDNDETDVEEIRFLKSYTVFNTEQIEGLPKHFYADVLTDASTAQRIQAVETFFAATRADIRHGGDRAFYSVISDHIQMPPFEAFRDPESYYATLAHECAHWTGHPSRIQRCFGEGRRDLDSYAMEELVAELAAAFVCASLGLSSALRDQQVSYLSHWLAIFKSDSRAIFHAAAHAQRAADFLYGLQPVADETPQCPAF